MTPVAPALHLTTPVELLELLVAEPGPLEQERVVATYRLGNYTVGGVSAQAGTYGDLRSRTATARPMQTPPSTAAPPP